MRKTLFGLVLLLPSLQGANGVLTHDAAVQSQLPGNNFGNLPQLQVGPASTAYLRFTLSSLPDGTLETGVRKAMIRIYVNRLNVPGNVHFHLVEPVWSEKTLTFANAPVPNPPTDQFLVDSGNAFVSFDATKLVQFALRTGQQSFGVALKSAGAADFFIDSK